MGWKGWKDTHPYRRAMKGRKLTDPLIPKGYKHTSIGQHKANHMSYKPMQDQIEEWYKKEIRRTERGPRRDYLINDYHFWIQNGRPTGVDQQAARANPKMKHKMRRTDHNASPIQRDFVHDQEDKRIKRLLRR